MQTCSGLIQYIKSIAGILFGKLSSQFHTLRLATGFTAASSKLINNGFVIDRNYRDGYLQTWNFAYEMNLSKTWALELTYMGSKGTRLDIQRLYTWSVRGNAKIKILQQLSSAGITRRTAFPDLDGIARSLWETQVLWGP